MSDPYGSRVDIIATTNCGGIGACDLSRKYSIVSNNKITVVRVRTILPNQIKIT